jgi:hypothetical protein
MKRDFFPRPEICGQHVNGRDHRIFCPLVMREHLERLIRELAIAFRIGYYEATVIERGCVMLTLRPDKLAAATIPVSTGWLLGDFMEAKGKQDLWIRQKPEVLEVLREQAIIQSAESSNRIEGVTIPADRLRPVVLGKSKPRDRSEEEIAGYRKALDWIFSRNRPVSMEIGP